MRQRHCLLPFRGIFSQHVNQWLGSAGTLDVARLNILGINLSAVDLFVGIVILGSRSCLSAPVPQTLRGYESNLGS